MSPTPPAPEPGLTDRLQNAGEAIGSGAKWAWDVELLQISDVILTPGKLTLALLVLLAAWTISRWIRRGLDQVEQRSSDLNRRAAFYALGRVIHYSLLAIGAMMALEMIGIHASRFAVLAGAIGVGLGFGLQAIFNNFVSGLILLFDRSLKVGDFVELESGVHGEVRDIQIRATRIVTNDNLDILVPNSEFVSGRVVNWTHRDVSRRMRIPFGVAYGSNKELVKKAALEAAAEVPFTLSLEDRRAPQVWLAEFGDSSLNFELVVWLTAEATKRPGAVKAAYNWALETALANYGLEIPFPQRDLHVRSWLGKTGQTAQAAIEKELAPGISESQRAELAKNDAADSQKADGVSIANEPNADATNEQGRSK